MLYKAQCNHDGLQAGVIYELDDRDVEYRSGAIEAGFLTATEDHGQWAGADALDFPDREVLSTVGRHKFSDLAADLDPEKVAAARAESEAEIAEYDAANAEPADA